MPLVRKRRCYCCGELIWHRNIWKVVCKSCGAVLETKICVVGSNPEVIRNKLITLIAGDKKLKEISMEFMVTDQTMIHWIRKYIGIGYQEIRRRVKVKQKELKYRVKY